MCAFNYWNVEISEPRASTACLLPLGRIEIRYLRQFHVSCRGTLLNFRRRFIVRQASATSARLASFDRLTRQREPYNVTC